MSDPAILPGAWIEAARSKAAEQGFGTDLAVLDVAQWRRVCDAAVEAMGGPEGAPPGWRSALARQAGRVVPAERAQDEADARLAAEGEVFATDDDA